MEFDVDDWPWEPEQSRLNHFYLSYSLTGQSHMILTCTSPLSCTSGYSRARFHESITKVLEIHYKSAEVYTFPAIEVKRHSSKKLLE